MEPATNPAMRSISEPGRPPDVAHHAHHQNLIWFVIDNLAERGDGIRL
ncbi:hypothetical protein [Burkholderia perseverans]|nr:hypothetical protein [Burkholderia perseverans]